MDSGLALQEFVEFVVVQLVTDPKQASVRHEKDGEKHVYVVRVASDDMGRIIGRNGYTISAIRSLLDAAAHKHGIKATLRVDEHE
ncbi:MAG: KH domain-containing protein [Verrucomicrobiota bacterium]